MTKAAPARRPPPKPTEAHQPIDFRSKTFLVIDDIVGMRTFLRVTITTFGGVTIDMASTIPEAIGRLNARQYDVILCDYDLGPGKDGQLFLEEIKRRRLVRSSTIFMMVTAEQRYEKVVSAVELAPDDYLIKPFSGEMLRVRIARQMRKKLYLAPVLNALDRQDFAAALAANDELMAQQNPYRLDLMRLRGEIYHALGRYESAQQVYEEILAMREIPWAKMGKGKALYLRQEFAPSATLFEQVTQDNPEYLEAYDWLAKAQTAAGQLDAAQKTLERATERSPRSLQRRRALGETAKENGDLDTAETNFTALIDLGKYSNYLDTKDFANLAHVHADKGNFQAALAIVAEAPKVLEHKKDEAELYSTVMSALIHDQSGNKVAAHEAFVRAKRMYEKATTPPADELALDMLQVCLQRGDLDLARTIGKDLAQNNHENRKLLNSIEKTFANAGLAEIGRELVKASSREMILLNNEAVDLSRTGDLKGAVELLLEAAEKLEGNNVVNLNAAQAILLFLDREGWDTGLADRARVFMKRVRSRAPDDAKLLQLNEKLRALANRYQMPLESAGE